MEDRKVIDEIKKLKTYEIESEVIVGNKHYVSNIKTINLESVIEILDKYNNQESKATIFIDTEDMEERYGTQLYIEYLERYKNAWEELKEGIEINMDYYDSSKFKELVSLNHIEELSQKHNLGE